MLLGKMVVVDKLGLYLVLMVLLLPPLLLGLDLNQQDQRLDQWLKLLQNRYTFECISPLP